ncbi:unnamed protein product, partial [Gongylonema pulchrum]|uniref:Tolloid n=1 Tax=Gongylonema pulchrum TaxID=637853 RepID=A0A183DSU0_9BILA
VCGGHIIGEKGTIQSPRYPESYSPNSECKWVVFVPEGYQVALTFQFFNLETHKDCIYDRLEIYDGTGIDPSALLLKLCGQIVVKSVVSHFNAVLLRFISDSSFVSNLEYGRNTQYLKVHCEILPAFQVAEVDECKSNAHGCEHRCVNTIGGYECECNIGYSLRPDGKTCQSRALCQPFALVLALKRSACGGIINASNGTFSSPNFPMNYPPLKTCAWQIEADDKYRIIINFTHFDVEGMKSACSYDYVLIHNDETTEERYCGRYSSLVYTSTTSRIKVVFVSDNTIEKSGFSAYFITDLDECSNNNAGCQQHCTNTIGSYRCECENGYVLADDGHNCKEGGCNLQLNDPEGEVTSPNYPLDYPKGKNCNWHFVTTPGHRLSLSFEEFMLEEHNTCKYDHIEVFDGGSVDDASLGVFCGSDTLPSIQSSSNQLLLTMLTDGSVDRRGFKAFYSSVCGGNLKAEETVGFIYSHARYSDGKYEKKMRCEWRIQAEPGHGVNICFAQFDLERERNCEFDYVEIFDGSERIEKNRLPPPFTSTGRNMILFLNTDDSEERKGFVVEYRSSSPGTSISRTSTTRQPPREPIINND